MHSVRVLALVAAAAASSAPAQTARIDDFRSIRIALPDRAESSLTVEAFGRRFTLRLRDNRAVIDALPAAQRRRIPAGDRFLAGEIDGVPGSWVRLNRIDGRVSGAVFDGRELWLIDRPGRLLLPPGRRAPVDGQLVYRYSDLVVDDPIDQPIDQPIDHPFDEDLARPSSKPGGGKPFGAFGEHLREVAALAGRAPVALQVTVVTDTQFSDRHGGAAASVVAGRVNFVDGIYSGEVGVSLRLLHHEILADNDVLVATDPTDLLVGQRVDGAVVQPGFRQFMRSGSGSDIPFGGVAHLFTGRDLDGGTVGIAYLGVLCSTHAGYGINQDLANDTTSALVFAHELGHNFGAGHDDDTDDCPSGTLKGIMNSRISGSREFSACSIEAMDAELAGASCLIETGSIETIFVDGFEP